jgi:hypothetical protein
MSGASSGVFASWIYLSATGRLTLTVMSHTWDLIGGHTLKRAESRSKKSISGRLIENASVAKRTD